MRKRKVISSFSLEIVILFYKKGHIEHQLFGNVLTNQLTNTIEENQRREQNSFIINELIGKTTNY